MTAIPCAIVPEIPFKATDAADDDADTLTVADFTPLGPLVLFWPENPTTSLLAVESPLRSVEELIDTRVDPLVG